MAAYQELEQHAALGGAAAARAALEKELLRKTGVTRVTVAAPAFVPTKRIADGLQLTAANARVERTGPLTWSVRSAAGPLELRADHPDADISAAVQSVVVQGGRRGAVELPMAVSLSEVVVRPVGDPAVAAVVVSADGTEPVSLQRRDDDAWIGLVSTRFSGWTLSVEPGGPTTGLFEQDLDPVPGASVEVDVAPRRLEPATLAVGALDAALPMTIRLPNGLEVHPASGESLPGSAGITHWRVDWELDASGSFDIPAGASTLPLPRAVEVSSDRWAEPQRWLLDPSSAPEDVVLAASVDGSGRDDASFLIAVPGVRPGELRSIALDPAAVPAVVAHGRIASSEAAWRRVRGMSWASAGATVLFAGIAGLSVAAARASASEAQGLDDSDDADAYADLVEQTAARDRLANIGLWTGLAGTGVTATLTWRSVGRAKTHKAHLDAFEAARKVPHVASTQQSASGGEG
ncbi:MAG: hypothetical protein VX265_13445 [Myxococcota bacterium]|nr:hypothetical protein [Myxococcota bacterium]